MLVLSILPLLFLVKKSKIWEPHRLSREEWTWVGFTVWTGIALLWAVNRHSTLMQLELSLSYFYMYFLVKRTSPSFRRIIIWAVIISSIWVSIYAIYQYFWGLEETRKMVEMIGVERFSPDFITRLYTNRAFSTFVYPNALAGYLIILIPFTSIFFFKIKKPLRYLYLIIPSLQITALVLSKSKGGILSLVLSLLILFWLLLNRKWRLYATTIIILVLLIAISFPVLRKNAENSFGVRVSYWKAAARMIKAKPLTGFGPGDFARVFPRFKEAGREDTKMAHNNYLQVFSEGGILYFLLFVSFFYFALKNLHLSKDKTLSLGIQTAVFAFLIHSLVDFDFYVPGITLILFSIIPLGIGQSPSKKEPSPKPYLYPFIFLLPLVFIITLKIIWADAYYKEALYEMNKGNIKKAEYSLRKGIKIYPWGEDISQINYHFRLGELYMREGENAENRNRAITEFQHATKLDPYRFFYWERLSLLYTLKNDYKSALKYIERALYCYPSHPRLKKEKEEILNKLNLQEIRQ
ncbi:MAG: hypothetical protein GXO71_08075 [Caldiserica bacterium]|nr:hypothetical protein [Caldisericota bacterium]